MAKKLKWMVRLGPTEWAQHTYARKEGDHLKLLGSVQRGLQLGALAITCEGQYVQVVGDFVMPLNRSQILYALEKASASTRRKTAWVSHRAHASSVVIRVKRARVPVMH